MKIVSMSLILHRIINPDIVITGYSAIFESRVIKFHFNLCFHKIALEFPEVMEHQNHR